MKKRYISPFSEFVEIDILNVALDISPGGTDDEDQLSKEHRGGDGVSDWSDIWKGM